MTDSKAALADLWGLAGGDPAALERVTFTGSEPIFPTSFRIATAAQASIGAVALAASEAWRMKTGRAQRVEVDMRHALNEYLGEDYLVIAGQSRGGLPNPAHGLHPAKNGGYVRTHTAYPAHYAAAMKVLGLPQAADKPAIRAAVAGWDAHALEDAIYAEGGVAIAVRSPDEWNATPHGQALTRLPAIVIEKIGEAPARLLPEGPRPLSGQRVIDLTKVIAGPVAGRAMAAHGADVLHMQSPHLHALDWLERDTHRGKRNAPLDLTTKDGHDTLERLVRDADIFLQGFRPGAIAGKGFSPEHVAALRPGIVYVSLSAWGHLGPWSMRRGFDSLVQTASGYNWEEARAAGSATPKELPCQALDHTTGYLLALGAIMARLRQAREGGSWLVRGALAGTGRWIWGLGRLEGYFGVRQPTRDDLQDLMEDRQTVWGPYRSLRHAARMSETMPGWELDAVPPGTHEAKW